jgi:hypothetical protein
VQGTRGGGGTAGESWRTGRKTEKRVDGRRLVRARVNKDLNLPHLTNNHFTSSINSFLLPSNFLWFTLLSSVNNKNLEGVITVNPKVKLTHRSVATRGSVTHTRCPSHDWLDLVLYVLVISGL